MSEGGPAAVVRRVVPAPPHVVYDEWLDADALAEWMCPRPARATNVELDARVGGRFRIDIDDAGLPVSVVGTYVDLQPPSRLRFTWRSSTWATPSEDSVVTVTLEPHGASETLMTIHHALLPPDRLDSYERGWTLIAGQLDDALRRRG